MSYCVYIRRFSGQPHKELIADSVFEYDIWADADKAAAAAWKKLSPSDKKVTHIFVGIPEDAELDPLDIEKLGLRKARQWYSGANHRISFEDFDSDYDFPMALTKKEVKSIQKAAYEAWLTTEDGWRFKKGYSTSGSISYYLVEDGTQIRCVAKPQRGFNQNCCEQLGISSDAQFTRLFTVDTGTMHIDSFKNWS